MSQPNLTFAGNTVIAEPTPDGTDLVLTCEVTVGAAPQTRQGLASEIISFVEGGFRPSYFGEMELSMQGRNIQIGCLSESKVNFMAAYRVLKNSL